MSGDTTVHATQTYKMGEQGQHISVVLVTEDVVKAQHVCWCTFSCVHRFCLLVKDLEMMMQNLISSVFSSVHSVEEGVRLLDIFKPVFAREVPLTRPPTCFHCNI